MAETPDRPDVRDLVDLARRFADAKRYDEALELFQLALRIDPRDLGIRLAVARLRKLRRAAIKTPEKDPAETVRDEMRRASIDASHFVGLSWLYAERGEDFSALECLEHARQREATNPANYKLAGRIHFRLQDFDTASDFLHRALRFNPFDREAAELLGQVDYERKQFESSLAATIDAFLLLPPSDDQHALRLRRRIRTLRHLLGWEGGKVVALFREREEELHTAFDRLQWRRERFRDAEGIADGLAPQLEEVGGRLTLAARLRRSELWAHLSDEQVFALSSALVEESVPAGTKLFSYGHEGRDFYLLEEGEISVQRTTGYGTFPIALLKPGALFGEVGFITGGARTADAVALKTARLLRFDADAVEQKADKWTEYGVHVYWALWHALAGKLRATNEQLRTFFPAEKQPENFLRLRRGGGADSVEVSRDDKVKLLQEQGLTSKELLTLATFSRELRFESGSTMFEEGDEGREMYVVLEGKVLISKYIPGAGEEALAVLERGDFFGEMSLIEGEPRSADARALDGPVTVLTLDQGTIQEMLALDPAASLEFVKLLCRLLSKRLREIDEKVVTWRIFAGAGDDKEHSISA